MKGSDPFHQSSRPFVSPLFHLPEYQSWENHPTWAAFLHLGGQSQQLYLDSQEYAFQGAEVLQSTTDELIAEYFLTGQNRSLYGSEPELLLSDWLTFALTSGCAMQWEDLLRVLFQGAMREPSNPFTITALTFLRHATHEEERQAVLCTFNQARMRAERKGKREGSEFFAGVDAVRDLFGELADEWMLRRLFLVRDHPWNDLFSTLLGLTESFVDWEHVGQALQG